MGNVQNFYSNKALREDVRAYIIAKMDKLALDRMYKGEDVSGFKEAKEILSYAIHQMEGEFGKQDKTKATDIPQSF